MIAKKYQISECHNLWGLIFSIFKWKLIFVYTTNPRAYISEYGIHTARNTNQDERTLMETTAKIHDYKEARTMAETSPHVLPLTIIIDYLLIGINIPEKDWIFTHTLMFSASSNRTQLVLGWIWLGDYY